MQKSGENIIEFATKLKHLAASCKFGSFLQDALRDQLIYGIRNSETQKKLMEADLPFEESLQTAMMLEQIQKDAKPFVHDHHRKARDYVETYEVASNAHNKGIESQRGKKLSAKPQAPRTAKPRPQLSSQACCTRCLRTNHEADQCYYKTYRCKRCNKMGHLAVACRTRSPKTTNMIGMEIAHSTPSTSSAEAPASNQLHAQLWEVEKDHIREPYKVMVSIFNKPLEMVIDCGAAVSVISEEEYNETLQEIPIRKTDLKLQVYGGKPLKTLGEIPVQVTYQNQEYNLRLIVTKGTGKNNPALFGREWLDKIQINWNEIFQRKRELNTVTKLPVEGEKSVEMPEILKKYPDLCSPTCGEIKGFQVSLVLKENYSPIFCKARPVPLALKEKVSLELDKLVQQGILYPVRHSDWATPLVMVPKANGELRLCGDFRMTVNRQIETEHYPLPSIEDIFNTVNQGKIFSVLDLSQAYLQLKVAESSQPLLTINTHKGLYRYSRLPYGISAAPMLFQATMDQILLGIPNTMCYLDDILIAGSSKEDCQAKLDLVLQRLHSHNVRIRPDKCVWLANSVQYLGHRIDGQGIHPLESKVSTISQTPTPTNIDELRAYLGLLNYYGKFIPQLATELHALYSLLQKDREWNWGQECEEAFQKSKKFLNSNTILVAYDPERSLRLACDASKVGLGAVLSHVMDDGSERPIQFASKTLTSAERNYSNIEREALAVVFGVKKFHKYLFGRKFQLMSDHRPLQAIFSSQRTVSPTISARLQRWSMALSAYQFDFVYKKGSEHGNADALSRLPSPDEYEAVENPIFYFSPIANTPLTAVDVRKATSKDVVLQQLREFVQNGWPTRVTSPELQPYSNRKHELAIEDGCLIWGTRVIIPKSLQPEVLQLLHEGHQGISRTKSIARSYYWWPNMDMQIENIVNACNICQQVRPALPPTSIRPWPVPRQKWERVHIDLSLMKGQNVFLLVDAYSKWLEVEILATVDTISIIEKLRSWFAAYGLPNVLVSDNGPQFSSTEFEDFMQRNGIRHLFSPTYHPSSNGQVERMIQSFKNDIDKQILQDEMSDDRNDDRTLQHKIANFLFVYRTTPHSLTNISPAEAFLGRRLRTRFDLLKPNYPSRIEETTAKRKEKLDIRRRNDISYQVGNKVWVYQTWIKRRKRITWTEGQILKILGPNLFLVKIGNSSRRVHADNVRPKF